VIVELTDLLVLLLQDCLPPLTRSLSLPLFAPPLHERLQLFLYVFADYFVYFLDSLWRNRRLPIFALQIALLLKGATERRSVVFAFEAGHREV